MSSLKEFFTGDPKPTGDSAFTAVFVRLDSKGRGRIQISAELPIIYATGRRAEPPEVRFPSQADSSAEPKRARESKLEADPNIKIAAGISLQTLSLVRYPK